MTELRVRDVGTRHTPLIGLPGRIGKFPDQGSHPGPLSFYLLAPTYRLLGPRRGRSRLGRCSSTAPPLSPHCGWPTAVAAGGVCLAVAALLAVILRGYGANVLTQPWNPYLPLVAWIVVLLPVWSLLEGDASRCSTSSSPARCARRPTCHTSAWSAASECSTVAWLVIVRM